MPRSNPTLCGSISARPSPFGIATHNAGYRALGLPYTYVAFAIERTEEAILAMRYLGIRGFGVSMPHKMAVIQYLDRLDETSDKAQALSEALGVRFGGDLAALRSAGDYDILVNATSVGFHAPGDSVIPSSMLSEGKVVLDVVFVPPVSKLVQQARARGCVAIPGTRMLVHQAAYQFQLYTGREAPLDVMERALLETIEHIS
jgi:shikimate 5-dehydrogenase